jgi:hypothetical protein
MSSSVVSATGAVVGAAVGGAGVGVEVGGTGVGVEVGGTGVGVEVGGTGVAVGDSGVDIAALQADASSRTTNRAKPLAMDRMLPFFSFILTSFCFYFLFSIKTMLQAPCLPLGSVAGSCEKTTLWSSSWTIPGSRPTLSHLVKEVRHVSRTTTPPPELH